MGFLLGPFPLQAFLLWTTTLKKRSFSNGLLLLWYQLSILQLMLCCRDWITVFADVLFKFLARLLLASDSKDWWGLESIGSIFKTTVQLNMQMNFAVGKWNFVIVVNLSEKGGLSAKKWKLTGNKRLHLENNVRKIFTPDSFLIIIKRWKENCTLLKRG